MTVSRPNSSTCAGATCVCESSTEANCSCQKSGQELVEESTYHMLNLQDLYNCYCQMKVFRCWKTIILCLLHKFSNQTSLTVWGKILSWSRLNNFLHQVWFRKLLLQSTNFQPLAPSAKPDYKGVPNAQAQLKYASFSISWTSSYNVRTQQLSYFRFNSQSSVSKIKNFTVFSFLLFNKLGHKFGLQCKS